jgi:hypothetical protein
MNKEIKEIAEQVWGDTSGKPWSASAITHLEHFAELVRQDEREANIKLLEEFSKTGMVPVKDTWRMGLIAGANAIRGRTEPKSDFKNQMDDNWSGII